MDKGVSLHQSTTDPNMNDTLPLPFTDTGPVEWDHYGLQARTAKSLKHGNERFWVVYTASRDPSKVTILRHAYSILKRIHSDKVITGIALPRNWNDFPVSMLVQYNHDHPVKPQSPVIVGSLDRFLDFAMKVTSRLAALHGMNLRHGAIRPESITISADGGVWLQDFTSAAFICEDEGGTPLGPELDSLLPYLAPEWTGRTNRPVDHRSDLYSLGATFYHILTGQQLWGTHTNELDIANKQVTEIPPLAGFHTSVDAVIAKLLAKMPEDRYQTCDGLLSDLKDIKNRPFAPFLAGAADRASEFTMPRSLFGRQYQLNQLSAFHLESQERQQSGVVFVKGYPGVGKTALVKEWAGRMRSDPSVIFAQGKYQQTGTVAFSAIIQAFRELTRQILTEPALSIEHWGTAIQNAVKGDISSLTLLLPDVAHIFPKHSSAKPLYGQSSQRTEPNRLLAQFLRVFTERKKVILFLDDMQWCSSVDVQFIASFIRELNVFPPPGAHQSLIGSNSILFVCAYRDNLVGMDHHIRTELEDRIPSETIDLNSLTEEDVERVVSSTLRMPWEECEDLAKLIYARTWGNPAFMETMFRHMNQAKYISFNYEKKEWNWDLPKISVMKINEDIVDFLLGELHILPIETREVLRIAACLGDGYFSLFLLSRVMNISRLDISCYIRPAQELGLISTFQSLVKSRPIYIDRQAFSYDGEDYPWATESFTPGEEEPFGDQWLWENHKAREIDIRYEFIHTKIQEACYEMIPQDQLPVTHLTIGRNLKDYSIQSDEVLFEVCNHIGEAHALLQDSERREMAKLNLNAARKAITRAAFEHALQYSLAARTLLKNIPDGINNMFTLGVSQCLLQSLYNLARYEDALREAEIILQSSSNDLEVLVIGTEKIRVLQSLGRNQEAYSYGMEIIRFSGFRVPDDIWNGHQITVMTEWYKSGIDTEKTTRIFESLPLLQDQRLRSLQYLITELFAPAQFVNPAALPLICYISLYISVHHGNCGPAMFMLVLYAWSLCNPSIPGGNQELGSQIGKFGVSGLERYMDVSSVAKAYLVYGSMQGLVDAFERQLHYLEKSLEFGIASHSGEIAGYAVGNSGILRLCEGCHLSEVVSYFEANGFKVCDYPGQKPSIYQRTDIAIFILPAHQFLLNLQSGGMKERWRLEGAIFKESEYKIAIGSGEYKLATHAYWLWKLWLANIFNAPIELRLKYANRCVAMRDFSSGLPLYPYSCYHAALVLVDTGGSLDQLSACVEGLSTYVSSSHVNYQGMQIHLRAEMETDVFKKLDLYNQAIAHAETFHHYHLSAFMNERCGKFTTRHYPIKHAFGYSAAAIQAYRQWGCIKGNELAANLGYETITRAPASPCIPVSGSETPFPVRLQMSTLMQTASDISSEADLSDLLKKVLGSVVKTSGADYCALLATKTPQQNEQFYVAVTLTNDKISFFEDCDNAPLTVPWTVVNYVARTREDIVSDIDYLGTAKTDPFLLQTQPKSILAYPLMSQARMDGIIYLHSKNIEAFRSEKESVVRLLAMQASSCLQQARSLKALDDARTQLVQLQTTSQAHLTNLETTFQTQITELQNNLRQLTVARDEAEKATQLKSSFLANMSHEIRTPFNAVLVALELLRDSPLDTTQLDQVSTIQTASSDLLRIINDILDFSKIESNKMELECQRFSLREAAETAMELVSGSFMNKELQFGYIAQFDESIAGEVEGDVIRVRQVLVNLLSNAAKFTERGHVALTLSFKRISEALGEFTFSVNDTGIGIDSEAISGLFGTFTQLDPSTTRKYGGTGLGLPISSKLARLMGGDISTESTLGVGSTFHFSFPAPFYPSQSCASFTGRCIIAIESDLVREVFRQHFTAFGFLCFETKTSSNVPPQHYDVAIFCNSFAETNEVSARLTINLQTKCIKSEIISETKATISPCIRRKRLAEIILPLLSGTFNLRSPGRTFVNIAENIPLRILLAEDNPLNIKVEVQLFSKLGYTVDVVNNGAQAFEKCMTIQYDICFMDLCMPTMDGLEATQRICEGIPDKTQRPFICAMTANAMTGEKERCMDAGFDGYLSKPIQVESLTNILLKCKSGRN